MRRLLLVLLAVLLLSSPASGKKRKKTCEPRAVQACLCSDDETIGRMVCGAKGYGWTKCHCDKPKTEALSPGGALFGGILTGASVGPLIAGIIRMAGGELNDATGEPLPSSGTGAILTSIGALGMVTGVAIWLLSASEVPARGAWLQLSPTGAALRVCF